MTDPWNKTVLNHLKTICKTASNDVINKKHRLGLFIVDSSHVLLDDMRTNKWPEVGWLFIVIVL